jgi:hypothetical protein
MLKGMITLNVPIVQMSKTWVLFLLSFLPIYRILEGGWGKDQDFTFD